MRNNQDQCYVKITHFGISQLLHSEFCQRSRHTVAELSTNSKAIKFLLLPIGILRADGFGYLLQENIKKNRDRQKYSMTLRRFFSSRKKKSFRTYLTIFLGLKAKEEKGPHFSTAKENRQVKRRLPNSNNCQFDKKRAFKKLTRVMFGHSDDLIG